MLAQIQALGLPPLAEMTPVQARQVFKQTAQMAGEALPVSRVDDRNIPGPAGPIRARFYTPSGSPPFPIIVFYHGGGWVIGDLETHDVLCQNLAHASGCLVSSIDYRLAPETKFPGAVDDCYAALLWVAEHAAEVGGDPDRIGVAGDSAGGNLAAVVCLLARDRRGPVISHQLLLYPATNFAMDTHSHRQNAEGYLLTHQDMLWFRGHYLNGEADELIPTASPLLAGSHSDLPPALIITAEFDPLRDEGEAYGEKLRAAGGKVTVRRYDGMIHGFLSLGGVIDRSREAAGQIGAEVGQTLAERPKTREVTDRSFPATS